MDIAVVGLGYVGSVSAGCLVGLGHRVIGVDVDANKVDKIAAGISPILEPGLAELVSVGHAQGRLSASTSIAHAVANSDVAMLAVGTPSCEDGGIDDSYLLESIRSIGQAIRDSGKTHYVVMIRSTCLPPVHNELMQTLEQTSGLSYDEGLGYVCHPEFLRESVAVEDFRSPPKMVFGIRGKTSRGYCKDLYPGIEAPVFYVSVETAAMVKYADNCFHAVKVTFANEMGMICQALGVDSPEVMDLFCADRKLNISSKYLRPGTPFGGSCLPKDLRGLLHIARATDTPLKMLSGTYDSNAAQVEAMMDRIMESDPNVVGIVGLSFKEGTPDLRESPTVQLLERLRGRGVEVLAYDEDLAGLQIAELASGQSLDTLHAELLAHLDSDLNRVVNDSDVVVVYHGLSQTQWKGVTFNGAKVLDITGIPLLRQSEHYHGLYWQGARADSEPSAAI